MAEHISTVEQWRSLASLGNKYSASSLGHIRRDAPHPRAKPGSNLKSHVNRKGYAFVPIYSQALGKCRAIPVHKLIAEAFLGERPTPLHQINHKNGIKTDNRSDNLEYVTHSENIRHAFDTGLAIGPAKLTVEQVRDIRKAEGAVTTKVLAVRYGVTPESVRNIQRGTTWRRTS